MSAEAKQIRAEWHTPPQIGQARAIWTLLYLRYPEGRIRAMFAFQPEVKSKDDADRLRQRLAEHYGEQAVQEATRALERFWRGGDPNAPVEVRRRIWERRKVLLAEAYRVANRPPGSFAHLYEADYPLLLRILDEGADKVLGGTERPVMPAKVPLPKGPLK